MYKRIGISILATVFLDIFIAMVIARGLQTTILIWSIAIASAALIIFAVFLITK